MTSAVELSEAMSSIANKKGDFALFAVVMRADSPGRWDLLVAAPWLEVGKLKALGEFVALLKEELGEHELRQFGRIVTLKPSSPDIRSELAALNVDPPGRRFQNLNLFGADVLEAHVLRAKAPRNGVELPRARAQQDAAVRRVRRVKRRARGEHR